MEGRVAIINRLPSLTMKAAFAREVVAIHEKRGLIEVLFKELAQELGLGDYQMLTGDGIVHHLHIYCLAICC